MFFRFGKTLQNIALRCKAYRSDVGCIQKSFAYLHSKKGMFIVLIAIVWGLFGAMLFLNIYFRVRVFKVYKKLIQNRVEFGAAHIFNRERMEQEIYPKYPPHLRTDIETFVSHIRYSMRIATVLIALITLFGAILMYFK